jgi:hypothetical protein
LPQNGDHFSIVCRCAQMGGGGEGMFLVAEFEAKSAAVVMVVEE